MLEAIGVLAPARQPGGSSKRAVACYTDVNCEELRGTLSH